MKYVICLKIAKVKQYKASGALKYSQTCHVVTSIKQSPVLKGHLFLVLSLKISYELNLFLEVTCLRRPICPKGDLLIQV